MPEFTLFDQVRKWAVAQPDAQALIYRTGSIRYAGLLSLSEAATHRLQHMGLPLEGAIAVASGKDAGRLALIIALNRAGRSVLIVPEHLGEAAKRAVYAKAAVSAEIHLEDGRAEFEDLTHGAEFGRFAGPASGGPLFILTTSGSTGIPKGVCLAADGIASFFRWSQEAFRMGPGRRILSYAPLNFDLSLLEIWSALDAGATVLAVDSREASDADALQQIVTRGRPHLVQGVPLLYRLLLQGEGSDLPDVADIIVTGEALPAGLRKALAGRCPQATYHNVYGATETNDSFIFTANSETFGTIDTLPIGAPIRDARYRIATEGGHDLTGAGTGELHTATPFASTGYTDPILTEACFYTDGDIRYYRTGDLVQRDENGLIHLLGRKDFVVKVRGVRTNLIDIETALESHPAVKSAIVCAVRNDVGETLLDAVVQVEDCRTVSSLALRRHCVETLPRTALPHHFTIDDRPFPKTATGKADRHAIKEWLAKMRLLAHAHT